MSFLRYLVFLVTCQFVASNELFRRQQPPSRDDPLVTFVRDAFVNFGEYLSSGIYELRIPSIDPMNIPGLKMDPELNTRGNEMDATFRRVVISGLSNLTVPDVEMNVPANYLGMSFILPNLQIEGIYNLDGIYGHIFPVSGNGKFTITVADIKVPVVVKMEPNKQRQTLDVANFTIMLRPAKIKQTFENLLGGGHLGEVANRMIHIIGVRTFRSLDPVFQKTIGVAIRRKLVQILRRMKMGGSTPPRRRSVNEVDGHRVMARRGIGPIDKRMVQTFNDYFDQIVNNARQKMKEKHLDPVAVPDLRDGTFTNGILHGLTSMRRDGDAHISLKGGDAIIEVNVGFQNVTVAYKWKKRIFTDLEGTAKASASHAVIHLNMRVDITSDDPTPTIEKLDIVELGEVNLDVSGLGTFSRVFAMVASGLANAFRDSLGDALEGPVRNFIQASILEFKFINDESS